MIQKLKSISCVSPFFLIVIFVLTSCQPQEDLSQKNKIFISFPLKELFNTKYGQEFTLKYSHIDLDVLEEYNIEESNLRADVLFISDIREYQELLDSGQLLNLTPLIQRDAFDLSKISPIVTDQLRTVDGMIYGLSPRLESSVLYYNVDLFNQYKVPIPTNEMTWEEVIHLAQSFPSISEEGNQIIGLETNYFRNIPFLLIEKIELTRNLSYIDPGTYQVTMDSPEWFGIWKQVLNAFHNEAIYNPNLPAEVFTTQENHFLAGRTAMRISNQVTAYFISDHNKLNADNQINWGFVTVPVNPYFPSSNYYKIHEIYAIDAKSENPEAAWELIKFINGEYIAKSKSTDPTFINDGLPAYMDVVTDIDGRDIKPFYMLDYDKTIYPRDEIPQELLEAFIRVASEKADAVIQGELSVDEALQTLQIEGQTAIDIAKMELDMKDDNK